MWLEKNGKTWRIRELVAGDKVTLASGYDTKTAAKDAMTILRAEVLQKTSLIPRGGEMTLSAYITNWWPSYQRALKQTSRVSMGGVIQRYIVAMLGHLRLEEIEQSPMLVQEWVADLLDGRTQVRRPIPLSAKTVQNAHGILYMIFGFAIAGKYMRSNPCQHTNLPEQANTEMQFLDYDEAAVLLGKLPEFWRTLVWFLLATGVRWSEAMGLRVRDVDRRRNRVHVRINTVEVVGRFVDQTPKTKRSKRYVSFPESIGLLLDPLLAGKAPDDRVFLDEVAKPIRHKLFYRVWHAARAAAGLYGLRVHDLRHTHVAWLIAAKVHLSAISRRLGHETVAITDARYGHLLPEVDEGIVEAVEGVMAKIGLGEI